MDTKTKKVIKEAERLLALHAYDAAHDLVHHQSVLVSAQNIASHSVEQYDSTLLEVACMWHDVVVREYEKVDHRKITQDTAEYVKSFMLKAGFRQEQANIVYLAVKHHEFDDTPVNTEGKILFDADKLDNLNLERIRRFVASDRRGHVPKWKLKTYVKAGTTMIKLTRNKLHFDYSKQLFDKKVDELWDDKEVVHYAKKYGVDLDDIRKSLRKTNALDKFVSVIKSFSR